MKPWSKLYLNLLNDKQINSLLKQEKASGLCVYILAKLYLECYYEGEAPLDTLIQALIPVSSRHQVEKVLTRFDLFAVHDGMVSLKELSSACPTTPSEAVNPAECLPVGRADDRPDANLLKRKENKKEILNTLYDPEEVDEEFQKYQHYPFFDYVYPLALEGVEVSWWESVSMNHAAGWSPLLKKHKRDVILYYMRHLIATGKEDRIDSMNAVKAHLTNLIGNDNRWEKPLQNYLEYLER